MRILIITVYYLPSTSSAAQMINDLALEFLRQGHKPTVLAPDSCIKEPLLIADEDGVRVVRVHAGDFKNMPRWMRAVAEARLSAHLWRGASSYLQANPHDVVVFYSPSIFFGRLVKRLKRIWRCRTYLVLRDIFPKWAVDAEILRQGLAYWYFRRRELEQYSVADVIGVQSPANLGYFQADIDRSDLRVEVLFNWIGKAGITPGASNYRRRWGLQGKVVFVYGGNIGVAQDIDNLLRLARAFSEDGRFHLLFVGEGSEVTRLRSYIAGLEEGNVSYQPALVQDEYLRLLAECDVGLISLDKRLKTQNFPGKMLGYLTCNLPLLASVNSGNDIAEVLEEWDAGLVCLNGEDDVLYDYARCLLDDVNLRSRLVTNGQRMLAEIFSVERASRQIVGSTCIAD